MAQLQRSRNEWQRLVEEYEQSGMTQAQFAATHGFKKKALSNWIYRLRCEAKKMALASPVQFLPVTVRSATQDGPRRGLGAKGEIRIRPLDSAAIEAIIDERLTLRFGSAVDCDYASRLLAATARHMAC